MYMYYNCIHVECNLDGKVLIMWLSLHVVRHYSVCMWDLFLPDCVVFLFCHARLSPTEQ